jgi:hypothetical protein
VGAGFRQKWVQVFNLHIARKPAWGFRRLKTCGHSKTCGQHDPKWVQVFNLHIA